MLAKFEKVRWSAGKHINALNGVPELHLVFEVEAAPLVVAFNQHPQQAEKELQVLLAGRERKRIDGEVALLASNIEIRSTEDVGKRLEAAADVEDEGQRIVLLGVLEDEVCEIAFARAGCPRIRACGTSFTWKLK